VGSIEGRPSTSPTPPPKTKTGKEDIRTTSVLFVEQTRKGELAANLRQVEQRLQELTGFHIKVVERGGSKLSHLLANTNPWAGGNCGRQGCVTCEQGGDRLPPCTKRSIICILGGPVFNKISKKVLPTTISLDIDEKQLQFQFLTLKICKKKSWYMTFSRRFAIILAFTVL
jgi:hypothetical protein